MKHKNNPQQCHRALSYTPLALAIAGLFSANAALAQNAKPDAKEEAPATVIVTGVMAQTKAKDANISYNVLTKEDIDKFTPTSAADLLRDMPGVNVESNDGVARSEIYTRGMSVGSGGPTAGNFWASVMEDGLPVLPVGFSAMQGSNFYRADISTSRVESVRGGSAGTTLGSSAGGAFNFMSGPVRPGAAVQTRIGLEGDDYHLSWKEINTYYGKVNEEGDAGFNFTTFYRLGNGPYNPGYDVNKGGQLKANFFKNYETAGGGSGTLKLTLKHLGDNNAAYTKQFVPTYGYSDPVLYPGFSRNPNLFMSGGQHNVPTDDKGGVIYHNPENGYSYKQDAAWLKWDHDTGGKWSFNGAVKAQLSRSFAEQGAWKALYSLWNINTFQDQFNVNQGGAAAATAGQNLNRLAGVYELYNPVTGEVRAKVANNVGNNQGLLNYRTGQLCAAGTSTSPSQCVVYSNLPNANYDVRGGLVNGIQVPAGSSTSNLDQVLATTEEVTNRVSRDFMINLGANYKSDNLSMSYGLYLDRVEQQYIAYGGGFGLSAFADGQMSNLGARFKAANGTTYQLTDDGGWGRLGSGFGNFRYYMTERNASPYASAAWRITDKWDVNGSFKSSYSHYKTTASNWAQNAAMSSATSRTTAGGLDNNVSTWYDNSYFVAPAAPITNKRSITLNNYSGSLGYTFNDGNKIYYRYSKSQNNIFGAISRWTSTASLSAPFKPQAEMVNQEIAYNFNGRALGGAYSGQVTLWHMKSLFPVVPSGTNTDGTLYYLDEYSNSYQTKGVEAWLKWQATRNFKWETSATYATGKTISETTFVPGSPGPADDAYRVVTDSFIPKLAKWTTSNTWGYRAGDFWFNLRHRYMAARRLVADPVDNRMLPKQTNFDLSIQYAGIKNTSVAFEVRNLTNTMYLSSVDPVIATVTGVSRADIVNQLPNSASLIRVNASRSFWLTVKHDF